MFFPIKVILYYIVFFAPAGPISKANSSLCCHIHRVFCVHASPAPLSVSTCCLEWTWWEGGGCHHYYNWGGSLSPVRLQHVLQWTCCTVLGPWQPRIRRKEEGYAGNWRAAHVARQSGWRVLGSSPNILRNWKPLFLTLALLVLSEGWCRG